MKALVLTDYLNLNYTEIPEPTLAPDEVLVAVKAVGICGSDVHGFDGSTGRRVPPLVMGHEAAGEIIHLGHAVSGWQVGDRVTFDSTIYRLDDWYSRRGQYNLSDGRQVLGVSCAEFRRQGAFAEYVAVPQHILYRIPDSVGYTQAAMTEPVAVSLHAISLTPLQIGDVAVVIGAGTIGLILIQLLRRAGCAQIIAVDTLDDRLQLALQLGATQGLNPRTADVTQAVQDLTQGRGADIAFEAVGIEATVNQAVNCVRKGATVTLVGNLSKHINVSLQRIVTHQLRLQGSCAINGEYEAAIQLIAADLVNVNAILSAEAPLAEGPAWFARLYAKEPGLLKVVLKP